MGYDESTLEEDIIFYESGEYSSRVLDLNDAVVFEDEEGKHMLKMESVAIVALKPNDITANKIGKHMRQIKYKYAGICILFGILGFFAAMLVVWFT